MNPISFLELGALANIYEPATQELDAADPSTCSVRGTEGIAANGISIALCAILSTTCDRSVGVDRGTCKICICNGGVAPLENAALQKHILQTAYSATIAGEEAFEPATPDDATLWTAVDNVKTWAGAENARRFVDTLVYHQSVTPEKGADILNEHDLVEVG